MRMNLLVSCCVLALAGVASAQTTATAKARVWLMLPEISDGHTGCPREPRPTVGA